MQETISKELWSYLTQPIGELPREELNKRIVEIYVAFYKACNGHLTCQGEGVRPHGGTWGRWLVRYAQVDPFGAYFVMKEDKLLPHTTSREGTVFSVEEGQACIPFWSESSFPLSGALWGDSPWLHLAEILGSDLSNMESLGYIVPATHIDLSKPEEMTARSTKNEEKILWRLLAFIEANPPLLKLLEEYTLDTEIERGLV